MAKAKKIVKELVERSGFFGNLFTENQTPIPPPSTATNIVLGRPAEGVPAGTLQTLALNQTRVPSPTLPPTVLKTTAEPAPKVAPTAPLALTAPTPKAVIPTVAPITEEVKPTAEEAVITPTTFGAITEQERPPTKIEFARERIDKGVDIDEALSGGGIGV